MKNVLVRIHIMIVLIVIILTLMATRDNTTMNTDFDNRMHLGIDKEEFHEICDEIGWDLSAFLAIEPYKNGYNDYKNNRALNPWEMGSLGWHFYEAGTLDARHDQEYNNK